MQSDRRAQRTKRILATVFSAALVGTAAHAAPPLSPLASLSLTGAHTLRVAADGAISLDGDTLPGLGAMSLPPERGSLRWVTVAGDKLIEARVTAHGRGHVVLLRYDGSGVARLLDETIGANQDGDLFRRFEIDASGVRRWQEAPGVARCDGQPPLFLEGYDVKAAAWHRLPLPVPTAKDLAASAAPKVPTPRRALRFSSASNDGRSERADSLGAPRELDDDDPRSALLLGSGPAAAGAYMTARAPRTVELVAVRVDPPALPARLPAALVLMGGTPARALYRLPLGHGNGPRWFVLPQPAQGACVSFVVDEPATASDTIGIAEIALFAADDGAGGLITLAQTIAHGDVDAEGAAHTLEGAGAPAAEAALAALPGATPAGRVRLLRVLHAWRAQLPFSHPLAVLLETAHGEERELLVDTLAANPIEGRAEAERLLEDGSQTEEARADGAAVLARIAPREPAAFSVLLRAALTKPAPLGAAARRAAMDAVAKAPALGSEAVRALEALSVPLDDVAAAQASTLLAILGAAGASLPAADRATGAHAIVALGEISTLPFEVAVRALSALSHLDPAAAMRAAASVLQHSRDATLRWVALAALPNADNPGARLALTSAVRDEDARVRERALDLLLEAKRGLDASAQPSFVDRSNDPWPEVRRLAYRGLGQRCAQDPQLAATLGDRVFDRKHADPNDLSRADALSAYAHCSAASLDHLAAAFALVQPPEVHERAAQILADRGLDALPKLARALDHVFDSGAGAKTEPTAIAILTAIGRIGAMHRGDAYARYLLTLLRDAAADPFFPGVRMAAIGALASGCPEGAHVVFDRGDKDPEPAVQRAAELARSRCNR